MGQVRASVGRREVWRGFRGCDRGLPIIVAAVLERLEKAKKGGARKGAKAASKK